MRSSRLIPLTATAVGVTAALALAGCTGAPGSESSGENYVSGGTFVKATASDIGSIVPMTAVAPDEREVINYAYEALVYVTPDGDFVPWLAESWEETSTEVTYTLREGVTCHDGTEFDAAVAAENFNYHADPANATYLFGSVIPEGLTATGEGLELTVTAPTTDPFLLANTGLTEMVCQAGLDDPETLREATNGTGLFVLDSVEPQAYIFTKRDGYTWGPQDVTSETEGLPDSIEVRIIPDESTAANLLLSGEINAAVVLGADRARLDQSGYESVGIVNPVGEVLFNEREDRPTADPLVREALARAIEPDAAGEVIADGSPLAVTSLVTKTPLLCVPEEPIWSLPEYDLEAAGELLDEAGWELGSNGVREKDGEPLNIVFIYDAGTATHGPAAELVREMWQEIGVETELRANDAAAWSEQLYQTFDWDTGWVQISSGGPLVQHMFYAGETPDAGGLNFMFVDNPEYNELAEQAMSASPEETCDLWQQAEASLIERVDVLPLVNNILPTYMSGAVFEQPGYITPTSIRMLG